MMQCDNGNYAQWAQEMDERLEAMESAYETEDQEVNIDDVGNKQ